MATPLPPPVPVTEMSPPFEVIRARRLADPHAGVASLPSAASGAVHGDVPAATRLNPAPDTNDDPRVVVAGSGTAPPGADDADVAAARNNGAAPSFHCLPGKRRSSDFPRRHHPGLQP